jgi:drug/metabolite transporter (DMT)-like permease
MSGAHLATPRPVLGMVVATLLWGATFVVVRDSLTSLAPAAVVATRFGAAAALLALVVLARRRRIGRATLVGGVVTGLATAGGYLFQAIGLMSTSAGSSAFLTSAGTLLAGLFAWPILSQRPPGRLALGLLVALIGSALLSLRGGWTLGAGEAWTLLGAAVYALQIVGLAHWAPRGDALAITGIQAAVASLCTLPFAGDLGGQLALLDGAGWARIAYLVACGSVIAPLLQVLAQQRLSPGRVGLLFALEPVFALVFAIGVGGERFAPRWWLGAALILGAVVMVEWYEARRDAARPPTTTA